MLTLEVGKAQQRNPSVRKEASTVLFAVSRNQSETSLDPIVIISNRRYVRPPSGGATEAQLSVFAKKYYRPGQKYRLLFGGGESGTVTVKGWRGATSECSRTEAIAEAQTSARIAGKVMGLATNSMTLGRPISSRRAPTSDERAAISELARKIYRLKGIPVAQLQSMMTINMTAADLNGDGREEIIGTFLVKRPKGARAAHVLFLLAEPQGPRYKPALTQYGHITEKDLMSGASLDQLGGDVLAEILVDHIDLDRDGWSEVIIADTSFEGITYRIYKRQRGQWRRLYEFYNYRCAF